MTRLRWMLLLLVREQPETPMAFVAGVSALILLRFLGNPL